MSMAGPSGVTMKERIEKRLSLTIGSVAEDQDSADDGDDEDYSDDIKQVPKLKKELSQEEVALLRAQLGHQARRKPVAKAGKDAYVRAFPAICILHNLLS